MAQQPGEPRLDRRTLLEKTGATTVAGAMAALAGCGGGGGGNGGGSPGGGTDEREGTPAENLERIDSVNFVTWTQSQKPGYFEQTRMMQSEFEELGIPSEMIPQQFPQPYTNTLFETREYDLLMLGMEGAAYRLDPSFYLNTVLHSSNAETGGWNISGFEHDELDQLSEEQQRLIDQEERQSVVYDIQRIQKDRQGWTVYQSPNLASGFNSENIEHPGKENTVPGEGFSSPFTLTTIEAPDSGELDYGKVLTSIDSFNPLQADSADDIQFIEPFYDTLTKIGPSGRAENWLASDVIVENDTTVVVTLKDGVTFHDGEPVTAEDVAFSYRFQKENEAPYVATYLDSMSEVSAGDGEVTFSLSEPYAPWSTLTMGQVPILPRHVWENVTEENDISNPANYENKPPIGSGPFEFSRHRDGSLLEMTAVDDHPFAPNIDTFRYRLYGNKSTAQQALLNGDIDVLDQLPSTLRGGVRDQSVLTLNFQTQHGLRTLLHNERRGMPFTDSAFRRALSYLIPRKRIVNQVYDGEATRGGSIIAQGNEFWHNPEVSPNTYDPEQARTILEEAGYAWDDDGRLMYPAGGSD